MPSTSLIPLANLQATPQAGDDALFRRGQKTGERSDRSDFSAVMGKMKQKADETPEEFARRSAEHFVSIGLVQPILKKLRETNQAAPPFAPTDGEKKFRSLADAELAQQIVHSTHFPLVDRIAKQITDKARSRAGRTDAPGPNSSVGAGRTQALPDVPWSDS
jgi:Rod binding domain-containing protein